MGGGLAAERPDVGRTRGTMTKKVAIASAFVLGLSVSTRAVGVPPERDQKLLTLGAALGTKPLEILTWAQAGDLARLRLPWEKARTPIGKFGDYDVLETRPLKETELKVLSDALLDTDVFTSLAIRRPVVPGPIAWGAGCMCGGFQPMIGLRLRDVEGRELEVLLCFTCGQMSVALVRDRKGPVTESAHRLGLSVAGCAKLLRHFSAMLPDDRAVRWLRDDRERRSREGAVQQGVGPDERSPSAPARRSTP